MSSHNIFWIHKFAMFNIFGNCSEQWMVILLSIIKRNWLLKWSVPSISLQIIQQILVVRPLHLDLAWREGLLGRLFFTNIRGLCKTQQRALHLPQYTSFNQLRRLVERTSDWNVIVNEIITQTKTVFNNYCGQQMLTTMLTATKRGLMIKTENSFLISSPSNLFNTDDYYTETFHLSFPSNLITQVINTHNSFLVSNSKLLFSNYRWRWQH